MVTAGKGVGLASPWRGGKARKMPNCRGVRSRPSPLRDAKVALLPELQDAALGRGAASDLVHGELPTLPASRRPGCTEH